MDRMGRLRLIALMDLCLKRSLMYAYTYVGVIVSFLVLAAWSFFGAADVVTWLICFASLWAVSYYCSYRASRLHRAFDELKRMYDKEYPNG